MEPIVLSAVARDVWIGDLYNYHYENILKSKDLNDSMTYLSFVVHVEFLYSFARYLATWSTFGMTLIKYLNLNEMSVCVCTSEYNRTIMLKSIN